MNVSILSMQRIINYGSFLQAYALKRMLENLGHEVHFIDIKPGEYRENVKSSRTKKYITKCFRFLNNGHLLKSMKFRKAGKFLEKKIIQAQIEILGLSEQVQKIQNDCDAVVIGSDEVFNCAPTSSWGVSTQLFGNISVPIVISYAASCGYTVYDDVPEICYDGICKAFNNLKAISVRDSNTKDFVEKISKLIPDIHLDPVLVYDFDDEVLEAEKKLSVPDKYMIVYAYYNRINKKEEIDEIVSYAREHKFKIYCVGAEQQWCDEFPVWTPFEVLAAFKNASCIVTDTFHGTVMSAKYNKRFATLVRDNNANKLIDLMDRLGLEKHRVLNIQDFKKIISYDMDYTEFNKKICNEKNRTLDYFKINLC